MNFSNSKFETPLGVPCATFSSSKLSKQEIDSFRGMIDHKRIVTRSKGTLSSGKKVSEFLRNIEQRRGSKDSDYEFTV